jgi:Rieske 2Fe-2S family protein
MKDRIAALLDARRAGFSLPQAFYVERTCFTPTCRPSSARTGFSPAAPARSNSPGDYVTLALGANSLIVLRDRDGEVRAFHNTCRHRGSRICLDERGHANRLVCPYHQWVYELDGSLRNARQMPRISTARAMA